MCYAALVYALHQSRGGPAKGRVCVGQGFIGKSGNAIGIGNCCKGFASFVPGCPPKAVDIAEAFNK